MFVQVFSRLKVQEPFLVPAVAEPLVVWVMSGAALVEERDLGGEWSANRVSVGDFFLIRSPTPYQMRWRAEGEEPFQVMHLYLSVPLFERVSEELFGKASPVTLQDVSGGRDELLTHLLSLVHRELIAEGKPFVHPGHGAELGCASDPELCNLRSRIRPANCTPRLQIAPRVMSG